MIEFHEYQRRWSIALLAHDPGDLDVEGLGQLSAPVDVRLAVAPVGAHHIPVLVLDLFEPKH